ncbi:hypothetical protein SNEBB_004304 [Seison nebaliae]|nr:hypothetical protein SNEBB_004304 [Seison nebaliae]
MIQLNYRSIYLLLIVSFLNSLLAKESIDKMEAFPDFDDMNIIRVRRADYEAYSWENSPWNKKNREKTNEIEIETTRKRWEWTAKPRTTTQIITSLKKTNKINWNSTKKRTTTKKSTTKRPITTLRVCNINGVYNCPGAINPKEIIPTEPTLKELYEWCDRGKKYIECVNDKAMCCDMYPHYRSRLKALETQLKDAAGKFGRLCAGIGRMNAAKFYCAPPTTTTTPTVPPWVLREQERIRKEKGITLRPTRTTGRSTTSSTTTKIGQVVMLPQCETQKMEELCSPILRGRHRFQIKWSASAKMKWCEDVRRYVQCSEQTVIHCNFTGDDKLEQEVQRITSIVDAYTKISGLKCPGGLHGCESVTGVMDLRCQKGSSYFHNNLISFSHKHLTNIFLTTFLIPFNLLLGNVLL